MDRWPKREEAADDEVRKLVRPMTPEEWAEHQDPRGTGRCPWANAGGRPLTGGSMARGVCLAYGMAAMRRSES